MTDTKSVAKKDGNAIQKYELNNPEQVKLLANKLADYIKDNRLSVKIKGNDYVMCEGWQYAGNCIGVTPIIVSLADKAEGVDKVYKYRAVAELQRLQDGIIVGRGFAICSNEERNKRDFEEYAVASMAQTRAIGKAYRNQLSWIMKLAGYAETPAEEMQDQDFGVDDFALGEILNAIKGTTNAEELKVIYDKYPKLRKNPEYMKALTDQKLKLANAESKA